MPMNRLSAPAVSCETSAPAITPRGTSWSGAGLTTLMASEGSRQRVIEPPIRPLPADAVIQRLGAVVVDGGLPLERDGAALHAALAARVDQRLGGAAAAGLRGHEQVVHHAQATAARRRPGPEQRGEADGETVVATGDELHALEVGVGEQRAAERQHRLLRRVDLIE